ncbi:MAG TPA: TraR/DksA family transcriptional regulator [Rhodocyclaceae bacterium]|nr:TraR/DksA family transcriptional regulator [Rhodocyclaceae bacterium]
MEQPTPTQIAHLGKLLRERRTELLAEISEVLTRMDEHPYADLAGVPDPGDEALADLLIDVDNAMVHRDIGEIREIDAALQRIADGRYGQCIDCGNPIDHERLLAVPTALRCFPCQDRHERTHVHDETPSL